MQRNTIVVYCTGSIIINTAAVYRILVRFNSSNQRTNLLCSPATWSWAERETILAPWHGHTTTCYKFWQHFKVFIIPIILYQFQKDPFWLIILYDILFYFIHVYIVPGQGQTTLGDIFYGSRKVLSLWSLVACFKKYLCPLILCTFFLILYMYIASEGQTPHLGQNIDVNRKASSLQPRLFMI